MLETTGGFYFRFWKYQRFLEKRTYFDPIWYTQPIIIYETE